MKYTAIAWNSETEVKTEFDLRTDARLKTLVKKAVSELMPHLNLYTCRYTAEMPNVWTNGGIGTLTINDKYFVTIYRNDNEITIFS